MGSISSGDQTLLRNQTNPQYTIERLYSFGFPTMWTGRINDTAIARGDQTIAYDTGSLESGFVFANLVAGLEIWIGSAAGLKDIGRARILSISGVEATGTIIIDWSDDKALADDLYLTIKHVFPPVPKLSWFTATGPDFRKDGPPASEGGAGVDYVDQNEQPPPHVMIGRHYANELPAAGSLVVQLNAASSVAVASGASISTYLWSVVPSGPTISNTAIANPTITFTGNGRWQLSCTVTDSNGKSSTGRRAYRIGGGITEFSRGAYTSQFDDLEVNLSFTITSPSVTWSDFDDRALIILTAEDYYGSTQKTISFRDTAVYTDHQHIMYCGYLTLENEDLGEDGTGRFQMTAVSTLSMYLYSLSITGENTVTDWYEMSSTLMTVAGNLFHLFKYHSTLLDIADWWLPWSDTTKRSANELFDAGDLLEKARSLTRSRLMAMTATPQGEIWVEANLNLQESATRSAETTTMTLSDVDIANVKRVRLRRRGDVARVLLSGGSSTGLLGTFVPYLSASHDVARAEGRPSTPNYATLMLASQTEANNFAGRLAQVANAKYQEVILDFSGNYREVFNPADQQWTNLGTTFGATQTANLRAIADLENANCVPRQVTVNPPQNGFASINVIFEIEAPEGISGVTLPQPTVPSSDIDDGDFDAPAPPAWPLPEPPTTLPYVNTGTLFSFDDTNGCYIRRSTDSDWSVRNGTLTGASIQDQQGGFDPWWFTAEKQNSTNVELAIMWKCDVGQIFRSVDGGATWVDVTPLEDPPNYWGDSPAPTIADLTFIQRVDSIHQNKLHIFLATDGTQGWLLKTDDDAVSWSWSAVATSGGSSVVEWQIAPDITDPGSEVTTPGGLMGSGTVLNDGTQFTISSVQSTVSPFHYHVALCAGAYAGQIPGCGWSIPCYLVTAHSGTVTLVSISGASTPPFQEIRGIRAVVGDCGSTPSGGTPFGSVPSTQNNAQYIHWTDATAFSMDFTIDTLPTVCSGISGVRPIWMDLDSEDGSILYITYWANDNKLYLQKRDVATLGILATYTMGDCTEAEFDAKTFWCAPFTPAFNKNVCYVYGRLQSPQGLANPEHLILTTDGGSSWSSVVNSLGSDHIGSLQAWANGSDWEIVFVRNVISGSTGEFWRGVTIPSYRSNTAFQVNVDCLTIKDSDFAIAAKAAVGGEAINVSTDGGASWVDITGSHPAGSSGQIMSLVYV